MYNRKDIPELEAKIRETIAAEGNDETPGIESMIQEITGPSAGLIYNPDTRTLELAEGWIYDNDGNIVRLEDVTGPGTGMIYRDGRLVKAE